MVWTIWFVQYVHCFCSFETGFFNLEMTTSLGKFVIHHILLKFSETLLCTWLTPPLWPPTCPNWPEVRARLRWKTDKLGTNNFRVSPPRPKWPDRLLTLYNVFFFKIFPLIFVYFKKKYIFWKSFIFFDIKLWRLRV